MEMKEFLNLSCGRESDSTPKSTIVMVLSMVDRNAELTNKEIIKEYSSITASAEIYPGAGLTEIDIQCFSHLDADLIEFWEITKRYRELARDVEPNDERVPLLEVIVFPTKLQGQVFISAVNPCFSAPTADDLKNKNHILALAFNENNFYLVEPSQFDANEYIANAEREAAQKIAMLEQDEIERMKNGG